MDARLALSSFFARSVTLLEVEGVSAQAPKRCALGGSPPARSSHAWNKEHGSTRAGGPAGHRQRGCFWCSREVRAGSQKKLRNAHAIANIQVMDARLALSSFFLARSDTLLGVEGVSAQAPMRCALGGSPRSSDFPRLEQGTWVLTSSRACRPSSTTISKPFR